MDNNSVFWGKKDTSINFCESPYEKSKYIAEYYNTISAIGYVFVGIFFTFTKIKNIGLTLISLGIGTSILHGTQRYYGQILDELSMLVLSFLIIEHLKFKQNKTVSYIFLYASIGLYLASYYVFSIFFILFSCYQIYICFLIKQILNNDKNISNIKILLTNSYIITLLISFMFWIIDQNTCDISFIQLHALWHVGTAISIFLGLLFLVI